MSKAKSILLTREHVDTIDLQIKDDAGNIVFQQKYPLLVGGILYIELPIDLEKLSGTRKTNSQRIDNDHSQG